MKPNWSTLAWVFFGSLFAGVFICGIGLGAAVPAINYVAAPIVCPGGQMTSSSQSYTVSPTTSGDVVSLYCVDKSTGSATPVYMFPTVCFSGLIWGVLIFVVIYAFMYFRRRGNPASG